MEPLIQIKNVVKTYHDEDTETQVLHGVSFSVRKGEFVAIMGPSGSGKSTLLHILGFLDGFDSGEYIFDGKSAAGYSQEEIARLRNTRLGFVFQAFNLLSRTSVLENVKLPLLYSGVPEKDWDKMAREAVEAVGLTHRIDHEPSQLSGGERQRVAIARALVLQPAVIFADEPTGYLDSKSGKLVMQIIQHLNEDHGHTVVLITHETTTAEHANRILHITDGRIDREEIVKNRRRASEEFVK
jgi:putative ABC transport system ATP-binding protein